MKFPNTFSVLSVLCATAVQVSATSFEIGLKYGGGQFSYNYSDLVTDDGNRHYVGWREDGCWYPAENEPLGFVGEFCLDRTRGRAHAYWRNKPGVKTCLLWTENIVREVCGTGQQNLPVYCDANRYTEVECT